MIEHDTLARLLAAGYTPPEPSASSVKLPSSDDLIAWIQAKWPGDSPVFVAMNHTGWYALYTPDYEHMQPAMKGVGDTPQLALIDLICKLADADAV